MRWLAALLLAFAVPAVANDTLPPAPYAYRQLDDPKLEAKAQALMETLRCLTCHRLGQEGADVGPERVTFRHLGPAALLVHVLDPNREVAPQFLAAEVTTKSGDVWQGLLRRDDESGVGLRLPGGRNLDIDRAEIDSFSMLNRSLMPEGLEAGLSDAGLADLLAFLVR